MNAPSGEIPEIVRKVLVITPFGEDRAERRNTLELMRLKYIIEHKLRMPNSESVGNIRIRYEVERYRTAIGQITIPAIQKIAQSDIVIAMITELNANVIYELAVRNMVKPQTIIIVRNRDFLPVYVKDFASILYDKAGDKGNASIVKEMNDIASGDARLDWNKLEQIPGSLKNLIDKDFDAYMVGELQAALEQVEYLPTELPFFIAEIVKDLDPGRLLTTWDTFVPYAVYRIRWRRKEVLGYRLEDLIGDPVVISGNEDFRRLINQPDKLPQADSSNPLTLEMVIAMLCRYMEPQYAQNFIADQQRARAEIMLGASFGLARVPIVFRCDQPQHPTMHGKSFLPKLVAMRTVGETLHPHLVYLLLAYIEAE
jgi:hypothetical protein